MTFDEAIQLLVVKIHDLEPRRIYPNWIYKNAVKSYQYFYKHSKCSLGFIDWDRITRSLPYEHQKKWCRIQSRRKTKRSQSEELDHLINEYKDKLYLFVLSETKDDRILRDQIAIRFVRVAQSGNQEVHAYTLHLLLAMANDWVQEYKSLAVLNGYSEHIEKQVHGCIRRFRYAGSFTTYLYRTLQYSSLGLRPLEVFSLDEQYLDSGRSKVEFVVQDSETGVIEFFRR